MQRSDEGFTLVEVMVVLAIVAVLVGIAIPSLVAFRSRANDSKAKADVTHAATAELGVRVLQGSFTDDTARLDAMVPGLDLSADDVALHLVVGDVDPGDGVRVLLYARSRSGTWFGMHLVEAESVSDRYTCMGDAEADMTLAACIGADW